VGDGGDGDGLGKVGGRVGRVGWVLRGPTRESEEKCGYERA